MLPFYYLCWINIPVLHRINRNYRIRQMGLSLGSFTLQRFCIVQVGTISEGGGKGERGKGEN